MNYTPQYPSLSTFPSVNPCEVPNYPPPPELYTRSDPNDFYVKNVKIYKINNFIDNLLKEYNLNIEDDITMIIQYFSEDLDSFRISSITTKNNQIINTLNSKLLNEYLIETPPNVKIVMSNVPFYLINCEKFLKIKMSTVYSFNTIYSYALILAFNC